MKRADWVEGGRHVETPDGRVFFRDEGEGPTLVFVHGFPTSSHDWAPVVERLRGRFRCVSLDLLGFGASDKPRRAYDYPLQHRALRAVAGAVGIERATLVVHDYAVTLAPDALAGTPEAPFDLTGVVFLNGAVDPAQHRALAVQRLLASRAGVVLGPLLVRRGAVLRGLRGMLGRPDVLPEDDVWGAIVEGGGRAVLPRLLHYMAERRGRRDALVAALVGARRPIAFVWGLDDPVTGAHVLAVVRRLVPAAAVAELSGVGHYPHLEAPDEVASFIDRMATGWQGRG